MKISWVNVCRFFRSVENHTIYKIYDCLRLLNRVILYRSDGFAWTYLGEIKSVINHVIFNHHLCIFLISRSPVVHNSRCILCCCGQHSFSSSLYKCICKCLELIHICYTLATLSSNNIATHEWLQVCNSWSPWACRTCSNAHSWSWGGGAFLVDWTMRNPPLSIPL